MFTLVSRLNMDLKWNRTWITLIISNIPTFRGGTFTFFLLSERKEKESKNFTFLKERKVETFLNFPFLKERKGKSKRNSTWYVINMHRGFPCEHMINLALMFPCTYWLKITFFNENESKDDDIHTSTPIVHLNFKFLLSFLNFLFTFFHFLSLSFTFLFFLFGKES